MKKYNYTNKCIKCGGKLWVGYKVFTCQKCRGKKDYKEWYKKWNTKKIKLTLEGLGGNAFALMGAFSKQAKREKWTQAEIDKVLEKAINSDYDNLVAILMEYCEEE